MSATGTFSSQAMAEWMKLFPRQITETYTSSVKFMKQLTVVAISTITYLKNVFPEDSYTAETLGGIRLKILKKKCRDELAQFLTIAMTQAFEAFDKKYLQKMVICFYDGDCKAENLVEYHLFEYNYNPDAVSMNFQWNARGKSKQSAKYSFNNIRERTIHLIRAIVVVMQACQCDLPESYDICVRLYYNEDAPKDYQAPGFARVEDQEDHLASTLPETLQLGIVETPYHHLISRAYVKETIASSHEANPTQNPPEFEVTPEENDFDNGPPEPVAGTVRCPCNLSDDDADAHELITCQYCKSHQHAACFGLLAGGARAGAHCCTACSDLEPARAPTDLRLAALTGQKRQCLSLFRRALRWAGAVGDVMCAQQLGRQLRLAPPYAAKLMKVLHSYEVVDDGDDSDLVTPRQIFPDRLKCVMSKFFHKESDIVENLINESLSQDSQFDPLGDILSPMERKNLQTAATTSKIVEPKPIQVVEDEHLKEYINVISKDEKENGLPLSGSHNPINVDIIENSRKKTSDESKQIGVRRKRPKVCNCCK